MISDDDLNSLGQFADEADRSLEWPEVSWNSLKKAGVLEWSIPSTYGGQELNLTATLAGYECIAGHCLTTAFVLSQRDAAVRRIRDSGHDDLGQELLRPLACGGRFATVGISQLTTSRQFGGPALRAEAMNNHFVLNGSMPWVTGADQAHHIVAGAALADGTQVMLAVPTDTPGLRVGPPLDLMALSGSRTAEVTCDNVAVDRHWLLAGPAERVTQLGRGSTGGLETSGLALGLAGAAIDCVAAESRQRPEWCDIAERLQKTRREVREALHLLAGGGARPEDTSQLRAKANALVLRATQTALTASKGAGFVRPHPAQRWARQALFFLVWSCPRPAAEATVGYLLGKDDCG